MTGNAGLGIIRYYTEALHRRRARGAESWRICSVSEVPGYFPFLSAIFLDYLIPFGFWGRRPASPVYTTLLME